MFNLDRHERRSYVAKQLNLSPNQAMWGEQENQLIDRILDRAEKAAYWSMAEDVKWQLSPSGRLSKT